VLTLSQVPANARLGALVALSMATCLVATVLLVPALVAFVNRPWPTRRGAGWGGR
jgi:predicted RND superfamily exporter protein